MLHWRDQASLDLHLDKCSAFGTWKFCSAPCLCLTREAWCDRANDSFVAKWSYSELSLARYRLHSYVTKWKVTTPNTMLFTLSPRCGYWWFFNHPEDCSDWYCVRPQNMTKSNNGSVITGTPTYLRAQLPKVDQIKNLVWDVDCRTWIKSISIRYSLY